MSAIRTPSYRCHRASGQAVVTLNGKMIYLGLWQSKASKAEYDRVISEWLTGGRSLPGGATPDLTITELCARYWRFAEPYYTTTGHHGESSSIKLMLSFTRRLYGLKLAREFGPLALKAVRDSMITGGWCRSYVNGQTGRLRRMFKWAVENEIVPGEVWHALQAVTGLRKGKSAARESDAVKPVAEELVTAILPHVSPQVKAMIELQRFTGCRPGEVLTMRGCDIARSPGELWVYTPQQHKTAHHGHSRTMPLGPKAQAIIETFIAAKSDPQAFLFSPADAQNERHRLRSEARKTPKGQGNSVGSNRQRKPRWAAGSRYTVTSYHRAIQRGCDAAFPPPSHLARVKGAGAKGPDALRWETPQEWEQRLGVDLWKELEAHRDAHRFHPHQIRHSTATRLRKDFGLEAAQVILGHRTLTATQIYAEQNVEAARKIMAEVG